MRHSLCLAFLTLGKAWLELSAGFRTQREKQARNACYGGVGANAFYPCSIDTALTHKETDSMKDKKKTRNVTVVAQSWWS